MQEANTGRGSGPTVLGQGGQGLRKFNDSAPTRKMGVGNVPFPDYIPTKWAIP